MAWLVLFAKDLGRSGLVFAICLFLFGISTRAGAGERAAWTASRVIGSPEPPPPYTVEKIFSKIEWPAPLYLRAEPGQPYVFISLQGGGAPTKILRIPDKDDVTPEEMTTVLELPDQLIYGFNFDPNYAANRWIYVFSNGPVSSTEKTNVITRVELPDPATPEAPPKQLEIIRWRSMGHDGGDLGFGPDGMLYASTGDGTSDSDAWNTGQDITDLNGGVLRIDVRNATEAQPYAIPPDNPFLEIPGARGELWAFGLRNPWRMTVDLPSGQIWIGNNGQDMWESAHLLERGANFGWSVMEGNHPFHAQGRLGPTPPIPATIEHHHSDFRSLTGGPVYRGTALPELEGAYLYGDYSTGKIWGARHDGEKLTWNQELADTNLLIACMNVSPRGELLAVDHGGGIYRMIRAPKVEQPPFPRLLSETGLFADVAAQTPQAGVVPYEIVAPGWLDGAVAQRFLAVPGDQRVEAGDSRGWGAPDGTVVVQTLSLSNPAAPDAPARRIETRMLTRQAGHWSGYSYLWNETQTDAELAPKEGVDLQLPLAGPVSTTAQVGEEGRFAWRVPSRTECMSCHSRSSGYLIGLSAPQLDRMVDGPDGPINQLDKFEQMQLLDKRPASPKEDAPRLVDPYNAEHPLAARARAYLHVNCSCCHVLTGGGNSRMELEFTQNQNVMNLIGERPQHNSFGLSDAMLIAPGAPERSVLLHRLSRRGGGQMPPLVSQHVDQRAVALVDEWIRSIPDPFPFVQDWKVEDLPTSEKPLEKKRDYYEGRQAFIRLSCAQCHRIGANGGSTGPDLTGLQKKRTLEQVVESLVEPSLQIAPEFANTIIETESGRPIIGRVLQDSPEGVTIQPTDAVSLPLRIAIEEIADRRLSPVSQMPSDILNHLTKEQIWDLIAYVLAEGADEHEYFKPRETEAQTADAAAPTEEGPIDATEKNETQAAE